jgi:uncharacterized protein (TIGR02996 family)
VTDTAAFETAIADAPDDEAPRLVYADWLEERGDWAEAVRQRLAVPLRAVLMDPADDDARVRYAEACEKYGRPELGEFVRIQVELARNPHPNPALRRRELRLWGAVHHFYAADFPTDKEWTITLDLSNRNIELPEAVVRRGFVEHVTAPTFLLGRSCYECPEEGPCRTCHNLCTILDEPLVDLFARQPVTSATVSDLRPTVGWSEENGVAEWFDAERWGGSESDSVMPRPLFESLVEHIEEFDGRKVYPDVAAALGAISPAVIALGRRLAGLPPISACLPPPNTPLFWDVSEDNLPEVD